MTRNWQLSAQLAAERVTSAARGCQLRAWLPVVLVVAAACSGGGGTSTTTTTLAAATLPPTTTTTTTTLPNRAADDPTTLAQQLNDSERTIRDAAASPEAVDAAGMLVQLAYRRLAAHPEWQAPVLGALDPAYRSSAQHNLAARTEFRAMHTTLSDTLPAWRIVAPLPTVQLLAFYQEGEATYGVPWPVLAAVNLVETGMGRIQGLSVAGAQGPMQFLPGTWARYGLGGDVEDPHDAILGAANYLAANGGADGTDEGLDNALFHYNNSNHYVAGVRAIAAAIAEEPVTLRGYHAWEVVYTSTVGDVLLAAGYESAASQPAADYVAAHPDALLG